MKRRASLNTLASSNKRRRTIIIIIISSINGRLGVAAFRLYTRAPAPVSWMCVCVRAATVLNQTMSIAGFSGGDVSDVGDVGDDRSHSRIRCIPFNACTKEIQTHVLATRRNRPDRHLIHVCDSNTERLSVHMRAFSIQNQYPQISTITYNPPLYVCVCVCRDRCARTRTHVRMYRHGKVRRFVSLFDDHTQAIRTAKSLVLWLLCHSKRSPVCTKQSNACVPLKPSDRRTNAFRIHRTCDRCR